MSDNPKIPAAGPEALLKKIEGTFPKLTWKSYAYIDAGWDHEVIILDGKLVFRFPNEDDYTQLIKTEAKALKQLKPLVQVNIPDYTFMAPDFSFAGYKIIPGDIVSKEIFDTLSLGDRTEIAKQLAEFLTTLHTKTAAFAPDIQPYMVEDQQDIKQDAKKYLPKVLSSEEWDEVQEILTDVDAVLGQPRPKVLIHNDIYPHHLLWDKSTSRLGIIDFSDMCQGDPAIDFAELFEYGDEFVEEVYRYYQGPKDSSFLERAWTHLRWVGVYMMTDHFDYPKISFEQSRETFDRVKGRRTYAGNH